MLGAKHRGPGFDSRPRKVCFQSLHNSNKNQYMNTHNIFPPYSHVKIYYEEDRFMFHIINYIIFHCYYFFTLSQIMAFQEVRVMKCFIFLWDPSFRDTENYLKSINVSYSHLSVTAKSICSSYFHLYICKGLCIILP